MRAVANVYATGPDGLICVASARVPAGLWKEVAPADEVAMGADRLASALERALARSAELSGAGDPPVWDGGRVRDRARLLARVERDGGELVVVLQERVEDDYGVSWQDAEEVAVDTVEEAAARVLAVAT